MGKLARWTLGASLVVASGFAASSCVTEPVDVAKCVMEDPECPTELPVCKPSLDDSTVGRCEPCERGDCPGDSVCDLGSGRCVDCLDSNDCDVETPACKLAEKAQDNECVQCMDSADCQTAEKPACDLDSNACVACVNDEQCEGSPETPVCDTASHSCVACNAHSDCGSASAAQCDSATHSCVPCTTDEHCTSQGHLEVCSDGDCTEPCDTDADCSGDPARPACGKDDLCVPCTASNEDACPGTVCDPLSETCTNTLQGSKKVCEPCFADSECGDDARDPSERHRCIALEYQGAPQDVPLPGRCLQLRAQMFPECRKPFFPTISRESLSGAALADYCGINEQLTTCEAVLAAKNVEPCVDNPLQCASEGALCEIVGGDWACTYPCSGQTQCTTGLPVCDSFCTESPP